VTVARAALRVCTFGFPLLDDITGGMEVGDLMVLVGSTGTGKSFLSRYLVSEWRRQGLRQWLIDTQLHQATTQVLLDALAAGVSPRDALQDRLTEAQQALAVAWADTPGKAAVTVRNDARRAMQELGAYDERDPGTGVWPQVVTVDELSGLANPHDWAATSGALQALKSFAIRTGIPVLAVVSAPKETEARAAWLEALGPFADKIVVTDGLLPSRHARPQVTLIKNRKVGAITSSIEIGLDWSSSQQTYRQVH